MTADILKSLHYRIFSTKRVSILSQSLSTFISNTSIKGLDIGCGGGELAKDILMQQPLLSFTGVDILNRVQPDVSNFFHYHHYDGKHIPFEDNSFDFSMLVDVLHHTNNPKEVLQEAMRVTKEFILIKDHRCDSIWDNMKLRIMDWVGNKFHNVELTYNFLSTKQWELLFKTLNLEVEQLLDSVKIHQVPFRLIFGSDLHFIVKLKIPRVI